MPRSTYISLADLCRRTACNRATAREILDRGGHAYRANGQDVLLTKRVAAQIVPALRSASVEKRARYAALVSAPDTECVYFIQDEAFVKIGAALDARQRLLDLQVGNPRSLTLLFVLDGGFREERRLQEAFMDYHERGEWYRLEGHLKAFVDGECAFRDAESHESYHGPALNEAVRDAMQEVSQRFPTLAGGDHV